MASAQLASSVSIDDPLTALHVRYWLRCLKTLLPNGYTEQDSSRIPIAFFILSALDLLSALDKKTTPEERAGYANFIYSCQHPDGGFRAFPGTKFGGDERDTENAQYDPGNIAGTYFALGSLAILGDDMKRVDRQKILEWVKHMQWPDGSFGDLAAGTSGSVQGGQDVRFCMLAALTSSICGTSTNPKEAIESNINAEALAKFVIDSKVGAYDPWLLCRG
jgi:geranylgeranyl transferase type-1 subunit beta